MDLSPYLLVIKQASLRKRSKELHLTAEDLKVVNFDQIFSSLPQERLKAIKSLIASDYSNKLRLLLQLMHQETDLHLKFEIRKALNELQSKEEFWGDEQPENLRRIRKALESGKLEQVKVACKYVLDHKLSEFLSITIDLEKRFADPFLQQVNIQLMALKGTIHAPRILSYLRSKHEDVVVTAISCLGRMGSDKVLAKLFALFEHPSNKVREQLVQSLQYLDNETILNLVETLVKAPNPKRRIVACLAIGSLHLKSALKHLESMSQDSENEVRIVATQTLASFQREVRHEVDRFHLPRKYSFDEIVTKIQSSKDSSSLSDLLRELRDADGDDREKLKIYMSFLAHSDDRVRANAVEYMAPFVPKGHHDFFLPFLEDSDHRTRGNAIAALGYDSEIYQSYKDQVSKALKELIRSEQSVDQLTSLYCIGILCDEAFLDDCLNMLNSSNPAVSLKAREVLDSWGRISKQVKRLTQSHLTKFEQYLASDSYLDGSDAPDPGDSNPKEEILESNLEFWDRIRRVLETEEPPSKKELLMEVMAREPDFAVAGILLEYLSSENDIEILALLIQTFTHCGPEDSWASLHRFLHHSDSRIVYEAVASLVEADSFRMIPILSQRMRETDIDEGRNAEILELSMLKMILLREPLALQAMKVLAGGAQQSMLCFAQSLKHWIKPHDILLRDVYDVLWKANQLKTLELCSQYLVKFLHPDNYKGKLELALRNTKSEVSKKFLKELISGM